MVWLVFFTITFLIIQSSRSKITQLSTYAVIDNTNGNDTFTDDVLFEAKARSRLECTRHCVRAENCTAFTYHETTAAMTSCQGYSKKRTASSSQAQGTKSYILKGPRCPVSGGFHHDATNGMCYKAYYARYNYSTAMAICRQQGAQFITLDTEIKVQALLRGGLLRPGDYWLGLRRPAHLANRTRKRTASEYVWTSTGKFVGSVNYFYSSLPLKDDCVSCSFVEPGDFGWMTSPCDSGYKNRIFCEIM